MGSIRRRLGAMFSGGRLLPAAVIAAAILISSSIVIAAVPGEDGVITACYGAKSGKLRIIDAERGKKCRRGEKKITWNQSGPPGAIGAAGTPGASGPQGAPGSDGQDGADGQGGAPGQNGQNGTSPSLAGYYRCGDGKETPPEECDDGNSVNDDSCDNNCEDVPPACTPTNNGNELCNGVDEDCDGLFDEGNPNGGNSCSTGQPGVCNGGVTQCTNGGIQCQGNIQPGSQAEVCDDQQDNDCDGATDSADSDCP